MATTTVTRQTINQLVQDNDIVLLDFWAQWCGPCHSFAPVFEAASERHPNVVFGKVDADSEAELATKFGVRSIPTVAAIRDQTVVFSQAGALPPSAIDRLVQEVRDLNMEAVHAALAKEEGSGTDG